jgi:hypothetical protein
MEVAFGDIVRCPIMGKNNVSNVPGIIDMESLMEKKRAIDVPIATHWEAIDKMIFASSLNHPTRSVTNRFKSWSFGITRRKDGIVFLACRG